MNTSKKSMFVSAEGKSLLFTFILVSSLFLLWGACNGMIDVMDKHFQTELHLSYAQSAWVQFAHYLGYFLMALPAGWLATKLGYKGGIITGLLMVAIGGFWFIPATHIASFWAFLLGVCTIAAGLTFLETVANPYTTVLGPTEYAATRINLAQTCNGVGWICGPIAGAYFFYGKNETGQSTGAQTLWIPYVAIAVVVVILAIIFYFADVPDIKTEDVYHLDDKTAAEKQAEASSRELNQGAIYSMLLGNAAVLAVSIGMISWVILNTLGLGARAVGLASRIPHPASFAVNQDTSLALVIVAVVLAAIAVAALALVGKAKTITSNSIWSHPHFSGATLAQFFYVAAQSSIFGFFINYMTTDVPAIPAAWNSGWFKGIFEANKLGVFGLSDRGAAILATAGFIFFLTGRFTGAFIVKKLSAHRVLGLYGILNVIACLLIILKLGWLSVACVFLSYFFMSIMFPTIFALGIHGLGARAKRASGYIVMAIMGGAIVPKLTGAVADHYGLSFCFIVPLVCFGLVAAYAFSWPKFAQAESLTSVRTTGGH